MRRSSVIAAMICWAGLFSLAPGQSPNAPERATNVSLIRLIANPQALNGRRVRVAGYLSNNGLDKAVGVYVTELDGRNFIMANSVDLDIEESTINKLVGKYVILDATYHAPTGPLAGYMNGRLDHVSGIKLLNRDGPPK